MNINNLNRIFGVAKPDEELIDSTNNSLVHKNALLLKKRKIKKRVRYGSNTFKEGRWTYDEHTKFVKSCLVHGNNWRQVK